MAGRIFCTGLVCLLFISTSRSQTENNGSPNIGWNVELGGFVRGGYYYDLNRGDGKTAFSSGFSDAGFKLVAGRGSNFRAVSDIRFRYGSEFHKPVNSTIIKEAFTELSFSSFRLSAGQQIIKWGRTDFTSTNSRLNPQNYISRSPDKEDMDMGNIAASASWYASPLFDFQAVFVPFYRPSVLITDPIPLPSGVEIEQLKELVTDSNYSGYGLRANIHLQGTDVGVSWFDGYDPMPGIKLKSFILDLSGQMPFASTRLKVTPYKIRSAGLDFESVAGQFGLRGEAAYSVPYLDFKTSEYVPMTEIKWAIGIDYNPGNWKLVIEYSGKFIPKFIPCPVKPVVGSEPDYTELLQLLTQPGFDITEYVREQTGAFNRLYNYQLNEMYHAAGLRVEREMAYGKLIASAFANYNFTSRDFLVIPEIRIKPYDGVTITAGAEIYSGPQGSLYRLINDFMESIYAGLRVDF